MAEWKRNDNKVAYDTKYIKEHYDRVEIKFPKGTKDKLAQVAASNGLSVNQYLIQLVTKEINA